MTLNHTHGLVTQRRQLGGHFINAEVAALHGCASKSAFERTVRQELSCTLCKGNARMYDRSLLTLARGVGRGFMPGLDRPIDEAGDV